MPVWAYEGKRADVFIERTADVPGGRVCREQTVIMNQHGYVLPLA
jgi:hypothetical protein